MDTPPKKPQTLIPKSKYEMSLAEFPVAILSKRLPKDLQAIEYEDTIVGRDGQVVPRKWTLSPSSRYGFGSNQTLATLFELFQIWKEHGFESPAIQFGSIYNLIKRMDLEDAATAYKRIRRDLNALVGILIEAENAFWDNEKKAYVDQTFHLFERVRFYRKEASSKQQSLPFAYIKASEELWGSLEKNAFVTLENVDSKFFHSLPPTQQRLALYLGKMLHSAIRHQRNVLKLASQLPILAKNPRDAKKILSRACEGLLDKEFPYLTAYHYEKNRSGEGENIVFLREGAGKKRVTKGRVNDVGSAGAASEEETARRELLVLDILQVTQDRQNIAFYRLVVQKLHEQTVYRCIAETSQAFRDGEIRTTKARFFTDLVKRYAAEQGVVLNPRKRGGGGAQR